MEAFMVSSSAFTKPLFLILVFGIAGAQPQTGKNTLPLQVAKEYGVDSFSLIGKIKYTFNVKFNGKSIARSWVWDVANDRVTMQQAGSATVSYSRKSGGPDTSGEDIRKIDAQYINDQYWLLFPLHLAWDAAATITVSPDQTLPLGTGNATRITVTFPQTGGYTPGDAFDLFVDNNNRVKQWIYRHGNASTPTRVNFWEENRRVGPLLMSLNRPGSDSTFRVWFTDVGVQLKGSNNWLLPN